MSGVASVDPDALEDFAGAARELADRQRRTIREFDLAIEAARREPRLHSSASATARSLRRVALSLDELASDALRTADGFRRADGVLAALGSDAASSGDSGVWELDVPLPGTDWDLSWIAPGFPFWARRWAAAHARFDLEAGFGPRIEGGVGAGVVDGVLRLGAELEGTFGSWVKAGVATGYGPFLALASGELFLGASAGARAAASVGRNGVAVIAGAGAFAGAKASGEVALHAGPVGVGASGAVTAGIGAKVDLDASLGWQRTSFRYDLGATLGLGFEVGGELHVEPRDLFDGAVDLGDDALGSANEIVRDGVGVGAVMVDDAFDTGKDLLGKSLGRFLP